VKEDKLLKIEAELISSKEKNINRLDQIYKWIINAKSYTLENSQVQNAIKSSVAQLQNVFESSVAEEFNLIMKKEQNKWEEKENKIKIDNENLRLMRVSAIGNKK
ncbi:26716_t:CDS:1, partial [Racocetra persica]